MDVTVEKVRTQALALSASERASLAHDLILSLEEPADFDLGEDRESEIHKRVATVKEGMTRGRPADEVFAEIEAKPQWRQRNSRQRRRRSGQ